MITTFLIFFLVLFIVLMLIIKKNTSTDTPISHDYFAAAVSIGGISLIMFFSFIYLYYEAATSFTIDERILMYEEENYRIESNIEDIIFRYQKYEYYTYNELKGEGTNAMSLISFYPELKTDKLVQAQIELYISNNNKIKELKEEKIYIKRIKWLLYFYR